MTIALGFESSQSQHRVRGGTNTLGSGEVSRFSLITSPAVEVTEVLGQGEAVIVLPTMVCLTSRGCKPAVGGQRAARPVNALRGPQPGKAMEFHAALG